MMAEKEGKAWWWRSWSPSCVDCLGEGCTLFMFYLLHTSPDRLTLISRIKVLHLTQPLIQHAASSRARALGAEVQTGIVENIPLLPRPPNLLPPLPPPRFKLPLEGSPSDDPFSSATRRVVLYLVIYNLDRITVPTLALALVLSLSIYVSFCRTRKARNRAVTQRGTTHLAMMLLAGERTPFERCWMGTPAVTKPTGQPSRLESHSKKKKNGSIKNPFVVVL